MAKDGGGGGFPEPSTHVLSSYYDCVDKKRIPLVMTNGFAIPGPLDVGGMLLRQADVANLLLAGQYTAYTWHAQVTSVGRSRRRSLKLSRLGRQIPGELDGETPETALIVNADAAALQASLALPTAPPGDDDIARQGLSYREIAEVTGVPIGTVMSPSRYQMVAPTSAEVRFKGRVRQVS